MHVQNYDLLIYKFYKVQKSFQSRIPFCPGTGAKRPWGGRFVPCVFTFLVLTYCTSWTQKHTGTYLQSINLKLTDISITVFG